jgi:anaerobic selenocysteine-containing dehydrogenase
VRIETANGSVRARAHLDDALDTGVVCGQHGWWQACAELGEPGYDPFGPEGANLNRILRHAPADAVSGSPSLRGYPCEVSPAT